MTQTNEHAFESYCEQMLLTQGGWERGNLAEWDRDLALFPARVCAFLEDSQPVLWQKLHDLHGDALGTRVVAALAKELDLKGMLHVLRRGFKFHGKTLVPVQGACPGALRGGPGRGAHDDPSAGGAHALPALQPGERPRDHPLRGREPGAPDGLAAVLETRGPQPNLRFFAFTATPKPRTLELFGRRIDPDPARDTPRAIHVYSMRQAIEEGFILDVLTNYTTYDVYYRLLKTVADDPAFPERKAAKALAHYMSLHEYNIEQKTAIMVEHFRGQVMRRLEGRAKAMVVTSSRLHAVRYMLAFQRYIAARGYPDVRPLVALSGIVHDKKTGLDYTEPRMNLDCVTGKPIGELEMLYGYGRFLLPHLHVGDTQTPVRLADEVALEYYRADRSFSGAIDLRDGESIPLKPRKEVGTGKACDPPAPLSVIIKALNERFGTAFSEEDRLFLAQIEGRARKDVNTTRSLSLS